MGGAACAADDRCCYLQEDVQMLRHDHESIYTNHGIVHGDAGEQFFAYHIPYWGHCHMRRVGAFVWLLQRALYLAQGQTHTVCHMQGDVVGARQRVVMCSHAALHVVAGRVLLFHFLLFVPAGEPLGTLFFCYACGEPLGTLFFCYACGEPLGTRYLIASFFWMRPPSARTM